ncbi:MAG: hypothetical protein GW827_04360, partial [Flavobacteriales bacterium]|nr:hypothetical protein [Flavobacteriales bacterium]
MSFVLLNTIMVCFTVCVKAVVLSNLYPSRKTNLDLKTFLQLTIFHQKMTKNKFSLQTVSQKVLVMKQIKKPISEREAITLTQEILIKYVGVYELQPAFQIEIERQNDRIFAKATGQPTV